MRIALLVILFSISGYAAARDWTNIVIILADDLAYGDIGAYGASRIRTPHIDKLAENGVRFRNGYSSANVCTPSRAGLMTGRYAIRSGLAWKVVTATDGRGLPEAEETLGELVQRSGYRTMLVGKWHLGSFPEYSPLKHGFDEFYGVPHSNDMANFILYEGTSPIEDPVDQRSLTRRYTARAVDFIGRHRDTPFLLFVSHTFPHIPLFASAEFHGRSAAGLYGDTVEELDWSTGEILNALEKAELHDNTLVIFTSDNGPFFEGSTGGLKGGKGTTWEAGYRVPFILSWPGVVEAGAISDAITMNIDVLPTIAEVLAVKPKAAVLDGRSLLPHLRGDAAEVNDYLYYFNNERVVGVRSPAWKYLTHAYYTGSLGAFEKFDELPGFEASYDMLFSAGTPDGEAYSLADRHPDVVLKLKAELERARREFSQLRTRELEATFPN